MQHLDEGTIHAWLDGALDAEEAARVERHATECAECAAAVAEARGLVAGASRILGALDQTPGGVIPAAARSSLGTSKAPRSVWRVLHFTPARAAAAALVIVAAGTVLVLRHAPNEPSLTETARLVSHGPPPPPTQAADTVAAAPELPPPAHAVDTIVEPKVPAPMRPSPSAAVASREGRAVSAQPPAKAALPVPTPRVSQLAERSVAAAVPAPRAPALPADSTAAAKGLVAGAAARTSSNAASAPAGVAGLVGGAAPARARAADRLSEVKVTALMDVEQRPLAALAGCYVVEADSAAGLPQHIVLDSLPGAARAARTSRILDATGSTAGTWERLGGNGVRLSIDRSAASPFDLHVTSPTTLTGTKTIGNRPITITIHRAAGCSAR